MPLPGSKPNEGKPVRHRVPPRHEWTQVEDTPFEGGPSLPRKQPNGLPWPKSTKRWWQVVSRMPHCILWGEADWQFALDTALIAAVFYQGEVKVATELRQLEKVMGTTLDSRRDLRIKYVEPGAEKERPAITAIEDYRKKLRG